MSVAGEPRKRPAMTAARSLVSMGFGLSAYQVGQIVWILIASRVMSTSDLAAVLAAQVIFNVCFLLVDNGSAMWGARRSATGDLLDADRASLVRLRLQTALLASPIALLVAFSGGTRTALAFAPYAVALVVVAAVNYWERWGAGDSAPVAFWLVARGGGLAALALCFYIPSERLPVWAPGVMECATALLVVAVFRLGLVRLVRQAARAKRGPWRSSVQSGAPLLLTQVSIASGVVMLNATGSAEAAAVMAVAARLLGGLNNGAGLLVGSLFPRLARSSADATPGGGRSVALVRFMQLSVVAFGASSAAVVCVWHGELTELFVPAGSSQSVALVGVLATAAAIGVTLNLAAVLIAAHRETDAVVASAAGAAVVLAAGVAIAASSSATASSMAGALVIGQLVGTGLTARAVSRRLPEHRAAAGQGLLGATVVACLALAAMLDPSLTTGCAVGQALVFALAGARAVRTALGARSSGARAPRRVAAAWHALAPASTAWFAVLALVSGTLAAWLVVHLPARALVPATAIAAIAGAVGIVAVSARRHRMLAPPVVMGVPLLLGLATAMSPVTEVNWPWDPSGIAVAWGIALAPLAGMALVAGLAATTHARTRARDVLPPPNPGLIVAACVGMVTLGVLVQTWEFVTHGAVPLLSSSIGETRQQLGSSGPLHLLSDGLVIGVVIAAWARFGWRDRFTRGQQAILVAIIVFVPMWLTLQGGRLVAGAPAIAAFIIAQPYLSRRTLTRVGVYAMVGAVIASVALIAVRFGQDASTGSKSPLTQRIFLDEAGAKRSGPDALARGVVVNLGEGYRVAEEFRRTEFTVPKPSSSVWFLHRFVAQAQNPADLAAALTHLWITSTYAGPVILDLGVGAALVYGLALGALLQWLWVRRSRARGPLFHWLYAYTAAYFAFLFYVELPTQLPFLWFDAVVIVVLGRLLMASPRRAGAGVAPGAGIEPAR